MTAVNPLGATFRIPMSDLRESNEKLADGFVEDVRTLLGHGKYILGDEVKKFENMLATFLGVKHAIGVSSGTTALEIAFRALGLSPTDEIIVPANTYIASAFGAAASGARLVPVDCSLDGTLDVEAVRSAVTQNTKAVLVVHLYGDSCPMEKLSALCKEKNLYLVEDCAQSLGSMYNGVPLGAWGDIACHSFYPSKNLGALGDAGAITTNNDAYDTYCRLARNLGVSAKYIHSIPGTNARMDTLQAMFLLRKFPLMTETIRDKRLVASLYTIGLGKFHLRSKDPGVFHTYHVYAICVKNRDAMMKKLAENGIETLIHYPIPFYKSAAFSSLNHLTFPNTEYLASHMISLPIFASMTANQVKEVTTVIHNEALDSIV
jgi:dTDP-4-amino-4,6-dideoxygalactose transaminase